MSFAALTVALALGAGLVPRTELSWLARVKDPARDALPADPAQAEQVRRGYRIFLDTPANAPRFTSAALSCGSCHLNAGQREGALPLVGIAQDFPQHNARAGRPFSLEDRVVGCFLRSMNAPGAGPPRDDDHENARPVPDAHAQEVRDLAAYLRWLSEGMPPPPAHGAKLPAAELVPLAQPDPQRGRKLFAERCANCHGHDGQGNQIGEIKPGPLWGPRSWNDGAGVSRVYTLAAFLRGAMPYTAPGTLSSEEAQQIAAFITSMPRPAFPAKARDYLTEPLPPDAVYYRGRQGESRREHRDR